MNSANLVTLDHEHVAASDNGFRSSGTESPIELADAVICHNFAALGKDEVGELSGLRTSQGKCYGRGRRDRSNRQIGVRLRQQR